MHSGHTKLARLLCKAVDGSLDGLHMLLAEEFASSLDVIVKGTRDPAFEPRPATLAPEVSQYVRLTA